MTDETQDCKPFDKRNSFSGWMALLARVSIGLFTLMAIYTLVLGVSAELELEYRDVDAQWRRNCRRDPNCDA